MARHILCRSPMRAFLQGTQGSSRKGSYTNHLLLVMHKRQTAHHEAPKKLSLDAYCDSDFAGVWHQEFAHLRVSCLSRTGFIIVLSGVPIHWSSKLQTEIALSSTEAEYIALSQCCRALLPMRRTLKDILSCGSFPNSLKINDLSTNNITTRKFEHHYHSNNESKLEPSTIWEDNQGCIH
jgi:hypothetical protein